MGHKQLLHAHCAMGTDFLEEYLCKDEDAIS